jgi:hypothetical protein
MKYNLHDKLDNKQTEAVLRSVVLVENFPSRAELYQLLDSFLKANDFEKNYSADNKDNGVKIVFKDNVCIK